MLWLNCKKTLNKGEFHTGSLLEKSLNFNRKIKINFDGGDLTSYAGLILYKEFDAKLGLGVAIEDTLQVELRARNVYTSRQIVRFIGPTLNMYKKIFLR